MPRTESPLHATSNPLGRCGHRRPNPTRRPRSAEPAAQGRRRIGGAMPPRQAAPARGVRDSPSTSGHRMASTCEWGPQDPNSLTAQRMLVPRAERSTRRTMPAAPSAGPGTIRSYPGEPFSSPRASAAGGRRHKRRLTFRNDRPGAPMALNIRQRHNDHCGAWSFGRASSALRARPLTCAPPTTRTTDWCCPPERARLLMCHRQT